MVKKFFLAGVILILMAGLATTGFMFFNTKADLNNAETALEGKTSELSGAKTELLNTQVELAAKTGELTKITGELEDIRDRLDEKTLALTGVEKQLENTNNELDAASKELAAEKRENTTLLASNTKLNADLEKSKDEVETLTHSITLYKETFGEVFAGVQPFYVIDDTQPPAWNATGPFIAELRYYQLVNNPEAENPTYAEVIAFLRADITDSYRYISDYYMCGNYAETVHNNAEAAGIRAAVVFIRFESELGHAINAFLTTDRGLVYIDSTGSSSQRWASLDCIVNEMKISQEYRPTLLFTSMYTIQYEEDNPIKSIEVYW